MGGSTPTTAFDGAIWYVAYTIKTHWTYPLRSLVWKKQFLIKSLSDFVFIMLINVKMPTIYEQDKFPAQLSWVWKKFYNLEAWVWKLSLILPINFCPQTAVFFLRLHRFKCTLDYFWSWKQTLWTLIRLLYTNKWMIQNLPRYASFQAFS